ncbi:MAG: hypothetical protein PWP11_873 [Thauera sp.]|nr:hypothetical protein [Thauera sp.]
MIESPQALDQPEGHEESPFDCRYGHGKLIVFPDELALTVPPPWPAETAQDLQPRTNPPHLRMLLHYCEHCTYSELHYVRDEA